jgi:hypothetical protein
VGDALADAVGSGERSRPDQNEGAPLPALDEGLKRGLESEAGRRGPHIAALLSAR